MVEPDPSQTVADIAASFPVSFTIQTNEKIGSLAARLSKFARRISEVSDFGAGALVSCALPTGDWLNDCKPSDIAAWERALRHLEASPCPITVCCLGDIFGPALDLLLVADHRVIMPGSRISLSSQGGMTLPGMAIFRLVRELGYARARPIVLFGQTLNTQDALDLGLVDAVGDDLANELEKIVDVSRRLHGKEFAIRRQLAREATNSEYQDALGAHLAACDRVLNRLSGTEVGGTTSEA